MPDLMNKIRSHRGGIIGYILIILAVVIVLGYFGFDVRGILESPQVQKNVIYVWEIIKTPFIIVGDFLIEVWEDFTKFYKGFGNNFESINPENKIREYDAQEFEEEPLY